MLKEFQDFIARGNVMDMAVGIIIGAAFTTIVKSLVDDVIMPPVGLLTGGVDFSNLFISLSGQEFDSLAAAQEAGAATLNYGVFINAVINFLDRGLRHFHFDQTSQSFQKSGRRKTRRNLQLLPNKRCCWKRSAIFSRPKGQQPINPPQRKGPHPSFFSA